MKKAAFKEEMKDVELMGDEDNGEVPFILLCTSFFSLFYSSIYVSLA